MALVGEAPDPKTFKSWEDAFKYPIPTTRKFQQQLKGDISSNRERLRSLVGYGSNGSGLVFDLRVVQRKLS